MRTFIAIATLALVAACGGSGDDAGAAAPGEAQQTQEAATEAPQGEPTEPREGDAWAAEYETPGEVVEKLQAAGVECEAGSVISPTAYSAAAQDCYVNADETDFYTVATYTEPAQQGEAQVWLSEQNPGATYVWGTGWSVKVPVGSDGSEVTDVIGGTVG